MEAVETLKPRWTPATSPSRESHPGLNGSDLFNMLSYTGNMSHPPTESPYATTKAALLAMRHYYTPMIACLGLVLNTIGWTTLLLSRLRKHSFSHYLGAAAVANSIYLGCVLIKWLSVHGVELYHSGGWCNFVSFADDVSKFLLLWFVVAFAIDRYIWFCHPTKSHPMCTPFRAKIVIICIVLIGLVVYMNISLTVGMIHVGKRRRRCKILIIFKDHRDILSVIDVVVNIFLPYIVLAVLMSFIMNTALQGRCLPRYGCCTSEEPSDEAVWKWEKKILCLRWTMWCRDPLVRSAKTQYSNVSTGGTGAEGGRASSSSSQPRPGSFRTSTVINRQARADVDNDRHSRFLTIVFLIMFFVTSIPLEVANAIKIFGTMFAGMTRRDLAVVGYTQVICHHVFVTSLCLQFWLCFALFPEVRSVCEDLVCKLNPRNAAEAEMVAQDDPSAAVSELGAGSGNSQSYV